MEQIAMTIDHGMDGGYCVFAVGSSPIILEAGKLKTLPQERKVTDTVGLVEVAQSFDVAWVGIEDTDGRQFPNRKAMDVNWGRIDGAFRQVGITPVAVPVRRGWHAYVRSVTPPEVVEEVKELWRYPKSTKYINVAFTIHKDVVHWSQITRGTKRKPPKPHEGICDALGMAFFCCHAGYFKN